MIGRLRLRFGVHPKLRASGNPRVNPRWRPRLAVEVLNLLGAELLTKASLDAFDRFADGSLSRSEPTAPSTAEWPSTRRHPQAESVGVHDCGHPSNNRGDGGNRIESAWNGEPRVLPLLDHRNTPERRTLDPCPLVLAPSHLAAFTFVRRARPCFLLTKRAPTRRRLGGPRQRGWDVYRRRVWQ